MTFDGTFNIPTLILFLTTFAGAVAWMVRLEGRIANNAKSTEDIEKDITAHADKASILHSEHAKRSDVLHSLVLLHQNQLAEYKTHVAEHYVTKQGMAEQTDRIMKGLADLGSRLDSVGTRLDRFYEGQGRTPPGQK